MSASRSAVRVLSLALVAAALVATRSAAQTPAPPQLPAASSLVPLRVVDPAGIDTVTSAAAVVARIASLQVRGIDVAFRYSPDVDPHDAAHYVTWLSQGGLGLPDRDYYTNTGPAADSLRSHYVDHLARLFTLAGQPATAAAGD